MSHLLTVHRRAPSSITAIEDHERRTQLDHSAESSAPRLDGS
jgi:hypothetical protein